MHISTVLRRAGLAAAALLVPAALAAQQPALLGRNLIANPGAEDDTTGWTESEVFGTDTWGHTSGEWDWNVVGAPNGGQRYFRLSIPDGQTEGSTQQVISVAPLAAAIDAGTLRYTASGWFGGTNEDHGSSALAVQFLDASGNQVGEGTIPPARFSTRPPPSVGSAALGPGSVAGGVPAGTRSIRVVLLARRFADDQCPTCDVQTFADNLSLVLSLAQSQK